MSQLVRQSSSGQDFQGLSRIAATNQSLEVLEALSRTALVLRDSAVTAYRGGGSTQNMQTLFQNGYDTLVALLQALPSCVNAYRPAAMIPETSVTLFHIHNLLLQAAFVSHQEYDVWTELMQAGLGLYLLRAPRGLVVFTNAQLDCVLDAMAHQDLWRFQGEIWQRLLPNISSLDSLEDFTSIVETCEVQAHAAATASVAAAAEATAAAAAAAAAEKAESDPLWPPPHSDAACTDYLLPKAPRHARCEANLPPWAGLAVPSGMAGHPVSGPSTSSLRQPQHGSQPDTLMWEAPPPAPLVLASSAPPHVILYDAKITELETYGSLMSECIRAAMEGAALRGLAAAPRPEVAATQLLEVAAGFEARQRSANCPIALRYSFVPSPEWLSQVAAVAMGSAENLTAEQVIKLLADLEALAPKPVEHHDGPHRWLEALGQAAVEDAVRRHSASGAWTSQQTVSAVKALVGKCVTPPGEAMCSMLEGLLLGCGDAKQDMELLCSLLQDAVELSSSDSNVGEDGSSAALSASAELSAAHLSLVRTALNRAIYLIGSSSAGAAVTASPLSSMDTFTSSSDGSVGRTGDGGRAREFLFDRYPRLLQAARCFDYPLQSFRLQEYAAELYDHLATAPGRELVAVGPEGLTRVLDAVASTSCCQDPQWAAAFERACLTMLEVQFSVGYTHPKRWLGLLKATVAALPFPMPALAAAIKALMVRLCDISRYAKYFWELLPLVGALERRAAAAGPSTSGRQHQDSGSSGQPLWTSVRQDPTCNSKSGQSRGSGRSIHGSTRVGAGAPAAASSSGAQGANSGASAAGQRPMVPPPDLSRFLVSEEEYSRWCEELGQRLALNMACLSDQDRVAQLSVLGIRS